MARVLRHKCSSHKRAAPSTRMFRGHRYELVGTAPSRSKRSLVEWAKFQKEANDNIVIVVKAKPPEKGYDGYIRKKGYEGYVNRVKIKK